MPINVLRKIQDREEGTFQCLECYGFIFSESVSSWKFCPFCGTKWKEKIFPLKKKYKCKKPVKTSYWVIQKKEIKVFNGKETVAQDWHDFVVESEYIDMSLRDILYKLYCYRHYEREEPEFSNYYFKTEYRLTKSKKQPKLLQVISSFITIDKKISLVDVKNGRIQ